jgi:enamine deaminase RidA (YjgF/YER057c/UK114 family)
MIKAGNLVFISGTAPVGDDGKVFAPNDAYLQAIRCFKIIEKSLVEFNLNLSHVIRTRMYVTNIAQWEAIGRAHKEMFGGNPPVTTMVEVKALIDPQMLIEVEADAVVSLRRIK